jgi:hypothetical protein
LAQTLPSSVPVTGGTNADAFFQANGSFLAELQARKADGSAGVQCDVRVSPDNTIELDCPALGAPLRGALATNCELRACGHGSFLLTGGTLAGGSFSIQRADAGFEATLVINGSGVPVALRQSGPLRPAADRQAPQ